MRSSNNWNGKIRFACHRIEIFIFFRFFVFFVVYYPRTHARRCVAILKQPLRLHIGSNDNYRWLEWHSIPVRNVSGRAVARSSIFIARRLFHFISRNSQNWLSRQATGLMSMGAYSRDTANPSEHTLDEPYRHHFFGRQRNAHSAINHVIMLPLILNFVSSLFCASGTRSRPIPCQMEVIYSCLACVDRCIDAFEATVVDVLFPHFVDSLNEFYGGSSPNSPLAEEWKSRSEGYDHWPLTRVAFIVLVSGSKHAAGRMCGGRRFN